MNNIENTYVDYHDILEEFGKEKVQERFEQILEEMKAFLAHVNIADQANVNEVMLMQAILDYFSDIMRLKEYQSIKHVNEIKIKAYESFWLIQRKPIQFMNHSPENDSMIYINEKFVLSRLMSYLLGEDTKAPLKSENQKAFKNFVDTLYYYLKFRRVDPQSMELMILAFKAGAMV